MAEVKPNGSPVIPEKEWLSPLEQKMKAVATRRATFNKTADERLDAVLQAYDRADGNLDKACTKHESKISAEEKAIEDLDRSIQQMSNS